MPTYERQTTVDAPLEPVWNFHSTVAGLEALTPGWLSLRVESVLDPGGERAPEPRTAVLEEGSEVSMSIRPFDRGPRQYWTSLITERRRGDGGAHFRDEMVHGPVDRWVHTHTFTAAGERTRVGDRVEYELSRGALGSLASPVSVVGLDAMFRYRHRLLRAFVEDGTIHDPRGIARARRRG